MHARIVTSKPPGCRGEDIKHPLMPTRNLRPRLRRRTSNTPPASFSAAAESYSQSGVDAEHALKRLSRFPISLHCWQGDDVTGFESRDSSLGGGIAVTGSHPGKARNPQELREDLDAALALIPGRHRLNLHAIYGEFDGCNIDRNAIEPRHFQGWLDWAQSRRLALDFNPTFFSHPLAESGWTLAHRDRAIRDFWVQHGRRCREIAAFFGRRQGTPSVNNVWIPDGSKDSPADRWAPRRRLEDSLDRVFASKFPHPHLLDAVEPKLFGLGSESYVAGSYDFYATYALRRKIALCLDLGHFHPTEEVFDKISALAPHLPALLLHVSRGVRWDSDHVVLLNDPLLAVAREVVRAAERHTIVLGLDYFDGSIHRVSAWVLGARNLLKALLIALLDPRARIEACENASDLTGRLFWQEAARTLPWSWVWDEYCRRHNVPLDRDWIQTARAHETSVLPRRI